MVFVSSCVSWSKPRSKPNLGVCAVRVHKSVWYTCVYIYKDTNAQYSYLAMYLSICLSTYLPIYLPIYPLTYLPIHPSIYRSFYRHREAQYASMAPWTMFFRSGASVSHYGKWQNQEKSGDATNKWSQMIMVFQDATPKNASGFCSNFWAQEVILVEGGHGSGEGKNKTTCVNPRHIMLHHVISCYIHCNSDISYISTQNYRYILHIHFEP